MSLICLPFVSMIISVIFKVVLKVAGDIESNPSHYGLLKSGYGSFSQENLSMFGETASRICACNALVSISWSLVRKYLAGLLKI